MAGPQPTLTYLTNEQIRRLTQDQRNMYMQELLNFRSEFTAWKEQNKAEGGGQPVAPIQDMSTDSPLSQLALTYVMAMNPRKAIEYLATLAGKIEDLARAISEHGSDDKEALQALHNQIKYVGRLTPPEMDQYLPANSTTIASSYMARVQMIEQRLFASTSQQEVDSEQDVDSDASSGTIYAFPTAQSEASQQ